MTTVGSASGTTAGTTSGGTTAGGTTAGTSGGTTGGTTTGWTTGYGGIAPQSRPTPSVEDLKVAINGLLTVLHSLHGPRSSAILLLGMPIAPDSPHDRFVANYYGPCLTARGLLAWGTQEIERLMDAQDTSKNGEPHP